MKVEVVVCRRGGPSKLDVTLLEYAPPTSVSVRLTDFKILMTFGGTMIYVISYDLNKPGKDYAGLFDKIKGVSSSWWHCLDSTWFVDSNYTAAQIRDSLMASMDVSDYLAVVGVGHAWATAGLSKECNQWLNDRLGKAVVTR
jgi:hypothetical protein